MKLGSVEGTTSRTVADLFVIGIGFDGSWVQTNTIYYFMSMTLQMLAEVNFLYNSALWEVVVVN